MQHAGELGSHQGLLEEMPSAREEGEWVMKQIPLASFTELVLLISSNRGLQRQLCCSIPFAIIKSAL